MSRFQYIEFDSPQHMREAVLQTFYARGWRRDGPDEPITSPRMADSSPWVRLSLSREAPARSTRELLGL